MTQNFFSSAISASCSWHYWAFTAVWKWLLSHETRGLHGSTGVPASLGQFRPQQLQHASTTDIDWDAMKLLNKAQGRNSAASASLSGCAWAARRRYAFSLAKPHGHGTGVVRCRKRHGLLADLFNTECGFHWFMGNFAHSSWSHMIPFWIQDGSSTCLWSDWAGMLVSGAELEL